MKRYVTKNPFETAAAISRDIKANTDKDVSRFTVSRRLNEFGFLARSPATKLMISKKDRKAKLDEDWDSPLQRREQVQFTWVRWQMAC